MPGKRTMRLAAISPRLRRLGGAAAIAALSATAAFAQPEIDVTPAQERTVRERMDRMAIFEASLNACGGQTDAEARVIEAVGACVEPVVLRRLAEHWRNALAELGDLALVDENRDEFCNDPELQQSLTGYVAYIDDLIAQAEEYCR